MTGHHEAPLTTSCGWLVGLALVACLALTVVVVLYVVGVLR